MVCQFPHHAKVGRAGPDTPPRLKKRTPSFSTSIYLLTFSPIACLPAEVFRTNSKHRFTWLAWGLGASRSHMPTQHSAC